MTHFTVMVVGEDVEGILAPYDENIETEEYIDQTKEEIHEEFIKYKNKLIAENKSVHDLSIFESLTLSLESENSDWVRKWCGKELDENGNTLSTYNPNSKWDWYQVGGRWVGTFILKPGKTGVLGERSWYNKDMSVPDNCVDEARKGDIDLDAMNNIAREQASKDWDDLMNPDPDKCMYRPEYVVEQRKIHLEMYGTKEEYIKRRGIWTPYAYVDSDGWNAPGEMGWFGVSSDETKDRDRFDQEFADYLSKLPDDTLLTMVDCHI